MRRPLDVGGPRVYANVRLGEGGRLDDSVVVGLPPPGAAEGELDTEIGPDAVLRSHTVVYSGVTIGARFSSGHFALIRTDNVVGDDVSVGTNATLEGANRIGDRVRIHTGCFVERAVIESDVFLGPHVVLLDDPHPTCPRYADCVGGVTIRRHASIGGNVTLGPGVEIGEGAVVGAGSVVVHDVEPRTVVAGNPARALKSVDDLVCWSGFFDRPYAWRDGN
jgi:acetyltransferase-like isoleucine patch superfamily enzyme